MTKYPQPKREPGLPTTECETKEEGSDWERNRYVGRSDPEQRMYFEVSIEEPLNIPIRVYKVRDPPLFDRRLFRDRDLQLNVGSVENARKLHEALGNVLDLYDQHEDTETEDQ